MAPQLVADAVTENRGDGDHKYEVARIEHTLFGKESAQQYQALARHDQAQQHLAFQQHDNKDDEVSPMTELASNIDQIVQHDPASPCAGVGLYLTRLLACQAEE